MRTPPHLKLICDFHNMLVGSNTSMHMHILLSYHHHQLMLIVRISLTLTLSLFLSLSLYIYIYIWPNHPLLLANRQNNCQCSYKADVSLCWWLMVACPCIGAHRRMLLISSPLLLQLCPTCLVCLT